MSERIKFAAISGEQSQELVMDVTEEEAKEAVFSIHLENHLDLMD